MAEGTSATVVLPTYEERATAPDVVDALDRRLRPTDEILVVDDSPTGATAEAVQAVDTAADRRVVRRDAPPDLSQAVLDGFDRARGGRVVVMDADGQHPPDAVPRLVEALSAADLAVASRHVGGDVQARWSRWRYLQSFGASVLAWVAVPDARGVDDPMSGMFAVRRGVVDPVRERLDPQGYKLVLELLARCPIDTVAEIPMTFRERRAGASNTDQRQVGRYVAHLARLAVASRTRRRPVRTQPPEGAL